MFTGLAYTTTVSMKKKKKRYVIARVSSVWCSDARGRHIDPLADAVKAKALTDSLNAFPTGNPFGGQIYFKLVLGGLGAHKGVDGQNPGGTKIKPPLGETHNDGTEKT